MHVRYLHLVIGQNLLNFGHKDLVYPDGVKEFEHKHITLVGFFILFFLGEYIFIAHRFRERFLDNKALCNLLCKIRHMFFLLDEVFQENKSGASIAIAALH